jgi:hypothetical protein
MEPNPFTAPTPKMALTMVIIALVLIRLIWSVRRCVPRPDPWDEATAMALEQEDATPVCHQCLAPYAVNQWFCQQCGRSVGAYNNLLPYVYIFSLGEGLRTGTMGSFRRTRSNIVGFVLASVCQYFVFAPVYWFLLARNLRRLRAEGCREQMETDRSAI